MYPMVVILYVTKLFLFHTYNNWNLKNHNSGYGNKKSPATKLSFFEDFHLHGERQLTDTNVEEEDDQGILGLQYVIRSNKNYVTNLVNFFRHPAYSVVLLFHLPSRNHHSLQLLQVLFQAADDSYPSILLENQTSY